LRLDPGLRVLNYAAFAALFVTGAFWLIADALKDSPSGEGWQAIAADLLMLHGITAMLALVLLGALIPLHMRLSWRAGKNRVSGLVMATANAALVATACGLYYAGSDALRTFAADIHIAVGLALPALIVTHIVLGRRTRIAPSRERPRPIALSPTLQPVTLSSEDPGFR